MFTTQCFAMSMEQSYLELTEPIHVPSDPIQHICRVSMDQTKVFIEDEVYFSGTHNVNRKFYVYFLMFVPETLASAKFTVTYYDKYRISSAGVDSSWISATGQITMNY